MPLIALEGAQVGDAVWIVDFALAPCFASVDLANVGYLSHHWFIYCKLACNNNEMFNDC